MTDSPEPDSEPEPAGPAGADSSVLDQSAPLHLADGLEGRTDLLLILLSVPFWGIAMYYALTQLMPRGQYATAFLGGVFFLYALMEIAEAIESQDYLDVAALVISTVVTLFTAGYIFLNFDTLVEGFAAVATPFELRMAAAFTLVVIYLTWRSFGPTFLAVVIIGIGYGFAGPYIPGALSHGGLSLDRTLRVLVLDGTGFFGFLTKLVAAWIALFLLYAGLLKAYGAFELILRLAVRAAKYIDSGIAQTAVISSAIIGSVNGSQTANAGMTGSFTIPLMRESGVKPETAGGIEAVASTSGQVLPPVMGAGAFIMAQLVQEPGFTYFDVIVAGLIPAAILVISIVVAVHYVGVQQIDDPEMGGMFDDQLGRETVILEGVKYGLPLFVLMYLLGYLQYTVMTSALATVLTMIGTGIFIPVVQAALTDDPSDLGTPTANPGGAFVHGIKQTIDGLRQGVIVLAPVAIILASINGVVDILTATGVPGSISLALIDLSGGTVIVGVLLAMVICILLGLGMPTTAAYTVVALLIQPSLQGQFGIPEVASHFFVFYAAILAGLTPPIATCVAVTCGISGGGFWGSCKEALRISAPLFVLPFAFVYHPELVSGTLTYASISSAGLALIGAVTIIHGINYRFAFGRTPTYGMRAGFFVLGILAMVYPSQLVQAGAVAASFGLLVIQVSIGKPDPLEAVRATLNRGAR